MFFRMPQRRETPTQLRFADAVKSIKFFGRAINKQLNLSFHIKQGSIFSKFVQEVQNKLQSEQNETSRIRAATDSE